MCIRDRCQVERWAGGGTLHAQAPEHGLAALPAPAELRGWLGEAGLDLTVTRQGEVYSLRTRKRPFTDAERAIVQAHLPTARWTEDGAWVHYEADFTHIRDGRDRDLEIGAAYAERLAMMLSEALRAEGFRVSRVGEERTSASTRWRCPGRADCGWRSRCPRRWRTARGRPSSRLTGCNR